ncbi:MAG: ATP-dependent DNA helicase [Acidimicrobiia bacterium]
MTTGIAGAAARTALQSLVDRLPGGETREGQLEMCAAVADALKTGEHLVVEAGTGVGKSLAYLVAAVKSGRRVVVATARRPLQDQLIRRDVPFVASAFPVEAAVLKGRSNYLCVAKLAEVATGLRGPSAGTGVADTQGRLTTDARTAVLTRLAQWVAEPEAGDLADAPVPVDPGLRSLVTVAAQECPGAKDCRFGDECLAERALDRARSAQLVVTNIDLYCLDLVVGGGLLGEHDAVIVDEAHELEAIASRTLGLELGRRRLGWLAAQLRGLLVPGSEEPVRLDRVGEHLSAALGTFAGKRVDPSDPAIAGVLAAADDAVADVVEVLRKLPDDDPRRPRAVQAGSSLLADLRTARTPPAGQVAWVPEGNEPVLHLAPVDVGPTLATLLHAKRTTILTSATLSVGGSLEPLAARLGLDGKRRLLRVASPFDYRNQALLYCAAHLPDPRRPDFDAAALDELAGLVEAAGGRTLALFTSHRMLRLAAEALRSRFPWTVLVQDGPPSPGLVEQFRDDEQACLLATMGYWQGVDVPGPSLSLVAVDRIPFPPLRDPLLDARRDAARDGGRTPFEVVDLPIAATLLAQGAGRLIRSTTDRGVVAVLDPRLAKASYRPAILGSLPRMRRTVDGDEVRRFLAALLPA